MTLNEWISQIKSCQKTKVLILSGDSRMRHGDVCNDATHHSLIDNVIESEEPNHSLVTVQCTTWGRHHFVAVSECVVD